MNPDFPLQLSWIISSAEKLSILSVGRYTYTSDLRFQPVMRSDPSDDDSETWTLRVRRVREEDEAKYECQINTKPEKSRHIYLRVVGEFIGMLDSKMENNEATTDFFARQRLSSLPFLVRHLLLSSK